MARWPRSIQQLPPVRTAMGYWYRWSRHRRADAYVLSFPKSGRTWLRVLIGRAIIVSHGLDDVDPADLRKIANRVPGVPSIELTHDDLPHRRTPEELRGDKRKYASKQVILLARDPRDVVVSWYFHATRRLGHDLGDLRAFIRADRGGFKTIVRWYNIWADNRHVPREFLVVRYEDLHADTTGGLRRVLDFVGLSSIPDDAVADAVDWAHFDRMRIREAQGQHGHVRLRPGDAADPESYKVRRGKVGGFADYLTDTDIAWLSDALRRDLSPFYGYGSETVRVDDR